MNDCLVDPADINITRGNNYPPIQWQFLSSENPDVIFPVTGSVFKLTIVWRGHSIIRSSDIDPGLTIDVSTSILTWNYSSDESRSLPLGRIARYEIERWIGGNEQTFIDGYVAVDEGLNPDSLSPLPVGALIDDLGQTLTDAAGVILTA